MTKILKIMTQTRTEEQIGSNSDWNRNRKERGELNRPEGKR